MDHSITSPHLLMFPLPTLGDLNPMLKLAELVCLAELRVTFINTVHNHKRLTKHADIEHHFSRYPGFEFKVIPDGLPEDHPRCGQGWLADLLQGLQSNSEPFLRERLRAGSAHTPRVTCLVADGTLVYAFEVAKEAEVPVIEFRGYAASFLWTLLCFPKLLETGQIPVQDDNMDQLIQNVPGISNILRRRDLPNFVRIKGSSSSDIENLVKYVQSWKTHPIILNTFEDLERPFLSLLQEFYPRIYSIGPLHDHLKYRLGPEERKASNSRTSLWEEDQSCISWLDQKPEKSVVYVSFGSLTILARDQLMEIWAGLVQSKAYFLWVVRPNMITGAGPGSPTPDELLEGTSERGLMVGWAPQEEVLCHRAVGGFMTHSGWNSTIESITAGVPMLCWPYFADQQVNSRFVGEVWRIGLDMKDTCDRSIVEKMVRELMDERRDELERSMAKMSHLAKKSVTEGGSSHCNLNRLIEDIKQLSITN